ncbi:MAG: S26 family signal peptidase [Planctomycetota bacterium]|nr:S26 family signal peptidase [Planctomycetota bacterium]
MTSDEQRRPDEQPEGDAAPPAAPDAPSSEDAASAPPPPAALAPESPADAPTPTRRRAPKEESPKEVIMSVIMSFALVFIFTRFVVASYVIPTGSMAPTLMGAHIRVQSAETGLEWPVNPWRYADPPHNRFPKSVQEMVDPEDTVTGQPLPARTQRRRSGDRIFVLHYLYALFEPQRWDVVVFKYPGNIRENYIKRLIGLPGEEVMLADGDVFTRLATAEGASAADDWRIRRKPVRIQRDLWYELFASDHRPLSDMHNGQRWRDLWIGGGWSEVPLGYEWPGPDPGLLRWNLAARPIDDWVAYNDTPQFRQFVEQGAMRRFPVSDLRLRASVRPQSEGLSLTARIVARGHVFESLIAGESAILRMRPLQRGGAVAEETDWIELARADIDSLEVDAYSNIEFWHYDQSLRLYIDGDQIAEAFYDWSVWERFSNAMNREVAESDLGGASFEDPRSYTPPRVEWSVEGAPVTLTRVGLDRDIYYQPISRVPAFGTSPRNTARMGADEFYVLGDNSAASGDSRIWDGLDPWAGRAHGWDEGVVPRELMMGKAFFVFWPSPDRVFGLPIVPDFGRMRMIR